MTKDSKLLEKKCAGKRCKSTFYVSKGIGERQEFCSNMCRIIHKGFVWDRDTRKAKRLLKFTTELAS